MNLNSNYINLIISPHLDDAVFSLGGLISKENTKTKIINVFSKVPEKPIFTYWDRMCGFANSTIAMNTRLSEDKVALLGLGVQKDSIKYLLYLDNQYRKYIKINQKEIKRQISFDIEKCIKELLPQNIRLFIPMNALHKDHRMVRDIGIELYKKYYRDKNSISLYLYQDMPYTFRVFLIKRLLSPFKQKRDIYDNMHPKILNTKREVIELSEYNFNLKEISIKKYISQIKPLFSDLSLLLKIGSYFSREQAKAFNMKSKYCEVIYKVL